MFLLTFVMVIIAMLGIYTQVYALETARLIAGESSVAQTFVLWHTAAASLAANAIDPQGGATGCSLTAGFTPTGVSLCAKGPNVQGANNVTVAGNGIYVHNGSAFPNLPQDYATTVYQWKSLAFQSNGYYVITYVDPVNPATFSATNPPPGYISTATTQINLTESDLYRQLQNLGIPSYSFGRVLTVGGVKTLIVPPITINGVLTPIPYIIPASIPDGALAIISSPGQCNGC